MWYQISVHLIHLVSDKLTVYVMNETPHKLYQLPAKQLITYCGGHLECCIQGIYMNRCLEHTDMCISI